MVKRPGLGKRKRVTLPPIEASEEPEQPEQPEQPDELPATQASASDPGDTATWKTQMTWKRPPKTASPRGGSRRRSWLGWQMAKRMRWLSDSRTIQKCITRPRRSTGTRTGRRLLGQPRPGPWAWKVS